MRWKALQLSEKLESSGKQTFGFKSTKCLSHIQFRSIRNKFLSKLSKDIKSINKTKELLVNADKSTNIYKMSKQDYRKHLRNNITKTYISPIETE